MNRDKLKFELSRDEGERFKVYQCSAGKWTLGVGRNVEDVGISKEESAFMLENDIARVEKEARTVFMRWDTFSDARQRAFLNMLFMGLTRFRTFEKMIDAAIRGEWDRAADEALDSKWAQQVGDRSKRVANLLRRGV